LPPKITAKPLITHEAKLVRMIQELELDTEGDRKPIVEALYVVLDKVRVSRGNGAVLDSKRLAHMIERRLRLGNGRKK
jgi:hypothetical protein